MPASAVIPVLAYADVGDAVTWLCGTFGFTERRRAGDHRAQLAVGDGAVAVREGGGAPAEVLVRVEDVGAHYARAVERGARAIGPPQELPYGERQSTVEDPGGHRWTFSQTVADVAPED